MVAGVDCRESFDVYGKPCSYPNRFARWLTQHYGIAVNLYNTAVGGTTTSSALPVAPLLLKSIPEKHKPDIVMFDFSVNDGVEPQIYNDPNSNAKHISHAYNGEVLAATEQLIRYLQQDMKMMVWVVEGMCLSLSLHSRNAHAYAAHFHGVHYSSYPVMADTFPGVCDGDLWGHTNHPVWMVHQMMAFMLASAWDMAVSSAATISKAEDLQRIAICTEPSFSWSAFDAHTTPPPFLVTNGSWQWAEDRPGKPGLLSSVNGSVLIFPQVKFGAMPRLIVSYLQGYENLGDMFMTLPTHAQGSHVVVLYGISHFTQHRTTQTYTVNLDIGRNLWQPGLGLDGVLGMGVEPHSTHSLQFRVAESMCPTCKVKLTSVLAC